MNKKDEAVALIGSQPGSYIISRALHIAIKALEQVEPPAMREISNISDMKLIRDQLFPIFSVIEASLASANKDDVSSWWNKMDRLQGR